MPNEEKGEILIENSSQAAVQGIASIALLKSMFIYTAEIEQELLNKPENTIIQEVYSQYQEKVISIICEAVNLLKRVIDCISSNAVLNYSEITNIKAILEETSNQMQDVIFDVAKESTYKEIEEFFEQFTQGFCQYTDASGIEIVS